ncbi:MAG TPA: DUF6600 domain-containing protein [Candidatus Sulfotelmatobacter sp.]|nr:DUF6600 domain-containing protein [Candidatus Sulfotelmatobacter sp.]
MRTTPKLNSTKFAWCSAVLALLLITLVLPHNASAQDQDDPPGRVARLGYMEGSVSFQPAGEGDWVGAVPNRPLTTGDQLWSDEGSRAEVQLGSAVIRLGPMTGFSFLDLDDNTVQLQLTSGAINVTVRRLHEDDDFEIDTPNQAFTILQPGHYRVEVGADGNYTIISVREGDGESTGGGQSYELRGGQRATLSGTDQLYADVEELYGADDFDRWSESRDHRYDYSRSAHYLSADVVGYEDLDDNGDWRDDPAYGHVWFPNRVDAGWAPYHVGHWAWISPWGWTWVDDNSWGYAPFHYGRWINVGGRWGWVAGPPAERAVYAPALVVFIGGGPGGWGGNVGWFALGPREVFVPSYHVSEAYVTRVNVSSTTVNVTQVTNVYHTTIINNNTTTITNITYANRNVQGAVMVVPQHAFVSAQPVAAARVQVSAAQIASAPMSGRVAVAPTRESVLGAKAATAGHVTAPPPAVASRQVVAKKTPPPPPVPFAKQQQALAAHPGQPLARSEVQTLRPAAAATARPMVKVAPPAKPATPTTGHPPANVPRPGQPAPAPAANRPGNPPPANERPSAPAPAQPTKPAPAPPANRPAPAPAPPANHPAAPPPANRPEATPNRPPATPPNNRPAPASPANRPPAEQPSNRPETAHPAPPPPAPRQAPPPAEHPQPRTPPPAAVKPAPPPPKQPAKPLTPEEKKRQEEEKKKPQ